MSDREGLERLAQVSNIDAVHAISHYLYFAQQSAASEVAAKLRAQGFEVLHRLGADGASWLVLATQHLVPTADALAAARDAMERLATEFDGEYDGWEAAAV